MGGAGRRRLTSELPGLVNGRTTRLLQQAINHRGQINAPWNDVRAEWTPPHELKWT